MRTAGGGPYVRRRSQPHPDAVRQIPPHRHPTQVLDLSGARHVPADRRHQPQIAESWRARVTAAGASAWFTPSARPTPGGRRVRTRARDGTGNGTKETDGSGSGRRRSTRGRGVYWRLAANPRPSSVVTSPAAPESPPGQPPLIGRGPTNARYFETLRCRFTWVRFCNPDPALASGLQRAERGLRAHARLGVRSGVARVIASASGEAPAAALD